MSLSLLRERHVGEYASGCERGNDLGIVAQLFRGAWRRNFLAVGTRIISPQGHGLDGIAQRVIDGWSSRGAPGEIGDDDP